MVEIECTAVLWSVGAAINFGAANSVANILLTNFPESDVPFVMQFAVWFIGGGLLSAICSLIVILIHQRGCSTSLIFNCKGARFLNPDMRRRAIMHCIISSAAHVVGLVLFRICFKIAGYEQNIGLLSGIIVIDLVITAVFCHLWLEERMSILQWLTVLVVFAGILCLCVADATKVSGLFWNGFPWALSASCLFLVSNMGIKYAFNHDMGAASLNFLRMIVVICCGVITLVVAVFVDEEPFLPDLQVWGLMAASGFFYSVGTLCLNYALRSGCTALSLAIVTGGSSVFVSVVADSMTMPHTVKIVGISLVGFAMASMLLLMCIQYCCSPAADVDANELGKNADEFLGSTGSPY
eukprot:GEMP01060641.1.p1 GENE.GEMP01060641.1~~GEMP01060641.1.p1  ORF type:complete len:353 (+),score=50.63 GEMP01060641.1:56-1114(+)